MRSKKHLKMWVEEMLTNDEIHDAAKLTPSLFA